MRRLAAAAAFFLPTALFAETPVIPGLPDPDLGASLLTRITGAYQYGGCVTSVVAYAPATGPVYDTAYCLHGLLLIGVRPFLVPGGTPTLAAYLTENVTWDPRIRAVYSELGDAQLASGTLTSASCPVGCAGGFIFSLTQGGPGYQWWRSDPTSRIDPATQFAGQSVRLAIGYTGPFPPPPVYSSEYPEFALTAVPEPATFALTAAGLGVMAVSTRRRRA